MVSLVAVSTQAADAYFQDYPDRVEFFDYPDFQFNVALEYYSLLDQQFQQMRKEGKQDSGFANVEIPSSWCLTEKIVVAQCEDSDDYYVETTLPVYNFSWDSFGYAINRVTSKEARCKTLTKISNDEWNFRDILPTHSMCFYKVDGNNRLLFADKFEEITVTYLPKVSGADDHDVLVETFAVEATKRALEKMFAWKTGNVIPSANDGAKNVVLPNQIDTKLNR